MIELLIENVCVLGGRGLEIGILPDGNLHATTGDVEIRGASQAGTKWTAFDCSGAIIAERRFDGPAWLPVFWKDHQLTAVTDRREDQKSHYQHRSRLVLLEDGAPLTLDEFDWEFYADRPRVIGESMWIGVSRGVGRQGGSFAWRWDGRKIDRLPIGKKMDWCSTPASLPGGNVACEVESFLAMEEKSCAVIFTPAGEAIARTPWIAGGGESVGQVFWVRDRLWVYTSRGALVPFVWGEGAKLVRVDAPALLGAAAGLSKDAPARLALYELLGEAAASMFETEVKVDWVLPLDRGALVGVWSFRRFLVRRIHADGATEAEVMLPDGTAMKKPVRHPLAGLIGILTDGTVVSIREARGSSTAVLPASKY